MSLQFASFEPDPELQEQQFKQSEQTNLIRHQNINRYVASKGWILLKSPYLNRTMYYFCPQDKVIYSIASDMLQRQSRSDLSSLGWGSINTNPIFTVERDTHPFREYNPEIFG